MLYAAMFHHFYDDETHAYGQGAVSLLDFQLMLDWLLDRYTILAPDEYARRIQEGKLKKSEICLTFDDALKCQYDIAIPELEARNIKAFFFVYSSAFGDSPDMLEFYRDFRNTQFKDIDEFYSSYFGHMRELYPNHYNEYCTTYPDNYLSPFPFYTDGDKRFRFVRDQILDNKQYQNIMQKMMTMKEYSKDNRKSKLFMSVRDLRQISNFGHTIGLHSDSHPTQMAKLSSKQQYIEYTKNKAFISQVIQQDVWAMSHPCGSYNKTTLSILRDLGIRIGFRSSLSVLDIKSDLEIPREDHANILKKIKCNAP